MHFKQQPPQIIWNGTGVAQQNNARLVCMRSWVPSPTSKTKRIKENISQKLILFWAQLFLFGLNFLCKLRLSKAGCKVVDVAWVAAHHPTIIIRTDRRDSWTKLYSRDNWFWWCSGRFSCKKRLCNFAFDGLDLFAPEVGFQAQCPYQNKNLVSGSAVGWEQRADLSEKQQKTHFEQPNPPGEPGALLPYSGTPCQVNTENMTYGNLVGMTYRFF